ncbi:cupin domain-containing protein [Saccharomonospora piscinae]|uniref:cupin domain-containing protein n=1 Tax=Saccharomonospora piscinae TaxID=687388 RepID=UPI001106C47D|nr:cupin domain-containing protein [Saccharomonospora piscinae]TLW94749.1 cupin domain-containing protein [Saccharomonospora piscinae]
MSTPPVPPRPPLAEALDLSPHPEGGWYRRTWETGTRFHPDGYPAERASATAIHYLLAPGERSRWHRVRGDELWLWHRGGTLGLLLGGSGDDPAPHPAEVILGPDVERGHHVQALVPAGTWQAAYPASAEAVLLSCVVSPGFDFEDFRLWQR